MPCSVWSKALQISRVLTLRSNPSKSELWVSCSMLIFVRTNRTMASKGLSWCGARATSAFAGKRLVVDVFHVMCPTTVRTRFPEMHFRKITFQILELTPRAVVIDVHFVAWHKASPLVRRNLRPSFFHQVCNLWELGDVAGCRRN